ncbi:M28 family metallopeptidase [Mariniphaga anaerophila]|uniref:M28 family metallopeptidase n=1 Tax=Mariniphaga anaerophila TaxID=1484053 RepID=UPI000934ABD1|nr:M28 family peptidase [Mariniphaga anaerophila]
MELPRISKSKLKEHVEFLAADSLQGRSFAGNSRALDVAADYLEEEIGQMGLHFEGNSYSQQFELFVSERDEENSLLKVVFQGKEQVFGSDDFFVVNQKAKEVRVDGKPFVAGFGLNTDNSNYDSVSSSVLKDRVVLVSVGTPESFAGTSPSYWDNKLEKDKTDLVFDAGARTVILVTGVRDRNDEIFREIAQWANQRKYSLDKNVSEDEITLVIAKPRVADAILGGKGRWKKALRKTVRKESVVPVESAGDIRLSSVRKVDELEGRNVIGIVEGTDSVLRNECVVFMAHYDHLGVTKTGEIFNGADDNASGTSTLLEVARAFSVSKEKPKRSIVFLWVTAEEVGLIGSEFYSRNPVFPMKSTVACVNLDMVGRVYEPRDSVWNHSPKVVKPFHEIYALVNNFDPSLPEITGSACERLELTPDFSLPENFFYSSDHYNFHRNEVPILNLSTGYTADYHLPTDDVERINFDKMKKVAELCYLVGWQLANR